MKRSALAAAALLAVVPAGCATLSEVLGVAMPEFSIVDDRPSTFEVVGPSLSRLQPAARVRLWTRVRNPNGFGLTLSSLAGDLLLERSRVAEVDLPLGLPLTAQADTVIPLDITVDLRSLQALGGAVEAILTRESLAYALEGRLGVDAGPLGTPTFGPRTWLQGAVEVRR